MILEIKDLKKKFGKFHALNGLDIMIPEDPCMGL